MKTERIALFLAGALIGVLFGMHITSSVSEDIERVKEQYRDCVTVGEYPTEKDML